MPTYVIKTLGCKANFYDSQLIEAQLQKKGWSPDADGNTAQLCIVNSCTVTDEADRQSRKLASRMSRDNPQAAVVVTGCSAEIDPERLAGTPGVHYVVGNRDKTQLIDLIFEKLKASTPMAPAISSQGEILGSEVGYDRFLSRHPMDREWPAPQDAFPVPPVHEGGSTDRTRSFLKIQEGCNSFCTFCIIPYGRGPSRSLKTEEVVERVQELVRSGVKEIVLTGTNLGDFGVDWSGAAQLASLIDSILDSTGLARLRLSSLDPREILELDLTGVMARQPRLCRHFHVSLQSASDSVLRLMKRKYGLKEVETCLNQIARLGAFVGMDVITGFPGETSEEFEGSLKTLEGLPWSRLHVFPYSERKGTPATRLPAIVTQSERVRRAALLQKLSFERLRRHYESQWIGAGPQGNLELESVLLERAPRAALRSYKAILGEPIPQAETWVAGYTSDYRKVYLPQPLRRNELTRARAITVVESASAGEVAFIGVPLA